MMLPELRMLLAACPPDADLETAIESAVVDDNVLGKRTLTTRLASFRQLRELYALEPDILIFRALRDLWDSDQAARPLLAVLCATARDPILRARAKTILETPPGPVTKEMLEQPFSGVPGSLQRGVVPRIGRNVAGSWHQSGHLSGFAKSARRRACRPPALAYALFLGHLCGGRGELLFETLWCQLLDTPVHILQQQAVVASRNGWLEYRHAGGVTEITFRYLEREEDGALMASAIEGLLKAYERHVNVPWTTTIAGPERVWFAIYDPAQERRLRARLTAFKNATEAAGHRWHHLDLTDAFAEWMAAHEYRDAYFQRPKLLESALQGFTRDVADRVTAEP